MKKIYIKPEINVKSARTINMICTSLLKGDNGGHAKGRITSADSRGIFFDEEEDYSDNANDEFFRSW